MKWSCFLSQAVLSTILMLSFEQVAHSQFLDSELYELCKQYPYNSRCKDIKELPLSLDDRSGETISNCAFMVRADHRKRPEGGGCKYLLKNDQFVLFIEQGQPLSLLKDQRPTVQIVIPANQIFSVQEYSAFRDGGLFGLRQQWMVEIAYENKSDLLPENRTGYLELESNSPRFRTEVSTWLSRQMFKAPETMPALFTKSDVPTTIQGMVSALPRSEGSATSTVQANIEKLLKTRACVRCDLRNSNLENAELQDVNLEGADLSNAKLTNAKLVKAYLVGAKLTGADLTGVDASDVRMMYADLSQAKLQNMILIGGNLERATLEAANLQDARLNTHFRRVTWLRYTNFKSANLEKAELRGVNLMGATLEGANLKFTDFRPEVLTHTIRNPVNFTTMATITIPNETILNQVNLTGANLEGSNINQPTR